jgi:D-arabinono-1,4-lactone oxidase
VSPDSDGFHHPASEDELVDLVRTALWRLLRDHDVPFRLHWGKFQPLDRQGSRDWCDFFAVAYPRWDDFLALRRERDPNHVFLTGYWRDRFALWDEPAPAATSG